jgi:hypothetical protein
MVVFTCKVEAFECGSSPVCGCILRGTIAGFGSGSTVRIWEEL